MSGVELKEGERMTETEQALLYDTYSNIVEKIADIVEGTIEDIDFDEAMDMLYDIKDVLKDYERR